MIILILIDSDCILSKAQFIQAQCMYHTVMQNEIIHKSFVIIDFCFPIQSHCIFKPNVTIMCRNDELSWLFKVQTFQETHKI